MFFHLKEEGEAEYLWLLDDVVSGTVHISMGAISIC